jgi:hypothetical protein
VATNAAGDAPISHHDDRVLEQADRKAASQTGTSILNAITDADIDNLFND